mmetsp:Transcript_29286/g.43175  ORF Transcript_29286/g.43175 Transcript_29286/m.43175 type:complete len:120 (+) Transcript_29286:1076-1435(+)
MLPEEAPSDEHKETVPTQIQVDPMTPQSQGSLKEDELPPYRLGEYQGDTSGALDAFASFHDDDASIVDQLGMRRYVEGAGGVSPTPCAAEDDDDRRCRPPFSTQTRTRNCPPAFVIDPF